MKKGILYMLGLVLVQAFFIAGCKKDLSLKRLPSADSDSVAHHVIVSTMTSGYYDYVAAGGSGSVYALRSYNGNIIYKVDAAGNKTVFYAPPAPSVADTSVTLLAALTTDSTGNVYTLAFSKLAAQIIKISPAGTATTYIDGLVDYKNAGGSLNIRVDKAGTVYFSNYNGIYKMVPGGTITQLSNNPVGSFDLDNAGDLILGRMHNVSKLTTGGVETNIAGSSLAGSNDGPVATATFNNIYCVASDNKGNIFVGEVKDGTYISQIRVITTAGTVYTLITSNGGYADGPISTAKIGLPASLVADASGNLYFAQGDNLSDNYIRKITFN